MGLGTEILFVLMLGLLVLGPKQLHTLLGRVARAKARVRRGKPQLQVSTWRRNSMLRITRARLRPRMNWLGTSEPSSDPRYRNSEPAG